LSHVSIVASDDTGNSCFACPLRWLLPWRARVIWAVQIDPLKTECSCVIRLFSGSQATEFLRRHINERCPELRGVDNEENAISSIAQNLPGSPRTQQRSPLLESQKLNPNFKKPSLWRDKNHSRVYWLTGDVISKGPTSTSRGLPSGITWILSTTSWSMANVRTLSTSFP
jgi:hypothetical protein